MLQFNINSTTHLLPLKSLITLSIRLNVLLQMNVQVHHVKTAEPVLMVMTCTRVNVVPAVVPTTSSAPTVK